MQASESSEQVAKYEFVGSTARELILLLWGLTISEMSSRVGVYIMSTLELLSPPAQKSTEPLRSHSISVISFLFLSLQTGLFRLTRLRISYMLTMLSLESTANCGAVVSWFQANVRISALFFFYAFMGFMDYLTSHSFRVSRLRVASTFWP